MNKKDLVDQVTTNGKFFINIYSDGSFGIEDINGGEIKGTGEDWIMAFQELVPRLRTASR